MGKPTPTATAAEPAQDTDVTVDKPVPQETETLKLGVYEVTIEKRTSFFHSFTPARARELKEEWTKTFITVGSILREVLSLEPLLLLTLVGLRIWDDMQSVVQLTLETRMLTIIESGLKHGSIDTHAVLYAIGTRLACVLLGSYITDRCRGIEPAFTAAIDRYYEDIIMKAKLNMDLPTLQENIKYDQVSASTPRQVVESILELIGKLAALIGQMSLVLSIVRSGNHGLFFALACMVSPIMRTLLDDHLWSRPRVVRTTNDDYKRMSALGGLTDKQYRHEVISGNLVDFITSEFKKAQTALGSIPTEYPEYQYWKLNDVFKKKMLRDIAEDLPMIYNALVVLLRPAQFSLTLLATLQQSSLSLRWSFYFVHYEIQEIQRKMSNMQQFYDLQKATKVVKDGEVSYPNGREDPKGMSFELKNIEFSYPADSDSPNDKKALDDVSFDIKAGELVVVVGENGSGKSTFINLLTRMYDVSSGEILVDGNDIRNLKQSDFRQAIATLTQDHHLLPLSLAENIGLGCPEYMSDKEKILEAARKGGCEAILKKLDSGLDTILDPAGTQYHCMVDESKKESLLAKEAKKLDKSSDVSGGERQRLVAARAFMRFNSKKVKFVAVDEPSSALDPRGEEDLFNNLREAREGKTMLFVTHRFGPITKYADRIICMKDGKLAEHGTHTELMEKQGEYYKMYDIQAKAFEETKDEATEENQKE
ncbi:hypothetical protein PM082_013605 [Marasmius tenuissimus]|nr:hypothetical protein PM082_013605 [Marasmius tenuissimus]